MPLDRCVVRQLDVRTLSNRRRNDPWGRDSIRSLSFALWSRYLLVPCFEPNLGLLILLFGRFQDGGDLGQRDFSRQIFPSLVVPQGSVMLYQLARVLDLDHA